MTIPRLPVLSAVLESVRQVPGILTDRGTGLWACALAVLSWAIGAANLQLLAIVIATMLLDLVLGSLWAVLDPRTTFDAHKLYGGILGKVVRLLAIPVASCADWLFLVSPFAGHVEAASYTYPVSAYVMWALAIAELVSSLRTLASAGVAPAALGALIAKLQSSQPDLPLPNQTAAPNPPAPVIAPDRRAR